MPFHFPAGGLPADLGWRKHRYPLPQAPTSFLPGTERKMGTMHRRLRRRRHLHHPGDARYTEDGLCRIPIVCPKNGKVIGFTLMTEREYRALEIKEPHWNPKKDLHAGSRAKRM